MPSRERVRDILIKATIPILIGILIYIIAGILANVSTIRIYDEFPEMFVLGEIQSKQSLTCDIRNNAPLTVPLINPFYLARITVENPENDTFAYFIGTGGKDCNFTNYSLDLGRIDAGSSREFSFYLCLGYHNATFKVDISYSFWIFSSVVSSSTYFVEYQGNCNYTISRL